jgi:Tol biopolymer transport system component
MIAFDAFISHSSKDKAAADATCAALEAAGIRCWIAPRDVIPGHSYGEDLIEALDTCRVMVLVFSSSSNASSQISREVERCVSRGITIVPLRIEDVLPTKAMAYFVGSVHWLDALTPPFERHLERLVNAVKACLPIAPTPDGAGQLPTAQAPLAAAAGDAAMARLQSERVDERQQQAPSPGKEPEPKPEAQKRPWVLPRPALVGVGAGIVVLAVGMAITLSGAFHTAAKPPVTAGSPPPSSLQTIPPAEQVPPRTLLGHTKYVNTVAFTPDGQMLASGSVDKTLKLWGVGSGQVLRTMNTTGVNWSIAFSPSGRMLAVASGFGQSGANELEIWDALAGQTLRTLTGYSDLILGVAFSPDGRTVATGGAEKTIKLWDATIGQPLRTIDNLWPIVSIAISPDGRMIAAAGGTGVGGENSIKLWDIASGQLVRSLTGHSTFVNSVAFSPDGRTLVSGCVDGTIKLWDITNGQMLRTLTGHTNWVKSVAFSPDGRTIASGSYDMTVKLWEVATGQLLRTLVGHSGSVTSVAFSPDGQTLASGSFDNSIKLWDISTVNQVSR